MAHRYLVRSLVALAAGLTATFATPAAAAPPGPGAPPSCWVEAGMYQQGETVYAYAFKDCTNLDAPQPLSLHLQVFICDPGHCFWPNLAGGTGTVHAHCSAGPMRNSRRPSEIFHCD